MRDIIYPAGGLESWVIKVWDEANHDDSGTFSSALFSKIPGCPEF
jgi:hypothetical protein